MASAAFDLAAWTAAEARIDRQQAVDGSPLLDTLPLDFVESLTPLEALALTHSPEAYLRPRQLPPADLDWLVLVYLAGRGWGKSMAGAGAVIMQVLAGTPNQPADIALVAPTIDDAWQLQWRVIKRMLPPWIRYTERISRQSVLFPDHGVELFIHSAEDSQYRGPNMRFAWCEEPVKWPRGEELWNNLRLTLRVPGVTPPRAIVTTTPPREIGWLLRLCADEGTRVVRGRMRDNPALDVRTVKASYKALAGTIEGARELDGRVVLGTDGALFRVDDLEKYRVETAPRLEQIVCAVDPAQSAKADADPVGIVVVGLAAGHIYVLESCSEKLEPVAWANKAISWADQYHAGQYVVESTGSGSYPRATLEGQMRIRGGAFRRVEDSKARGSKADRASPLSAACASGRLHLVGRHEALERELLTWHPGARFSPGGLDALVHGAATLTGNWRWV